MKRNSRIVIKMTPIIIIPVLYYAIFVRPVEVELVLITKIEAAKVQRPPIWWAQLDAGNKDSFHSFDEAAKDYISNYDFSQGNLVVSWGRSLESLTYQRKGYLRCNPTIPGRPVFSSVDTPTTIYIYSTTKPKNTTLRNSPSLDKNAQEVFLELSG